MKFNWGTGIVLAFVGFIAFILFFVVRMATEDRANHDLVTQDYYDRELGYQNEINAETNMRELAADIAWERTPEGLLFRFPSEFVPNNIQGTVSLYRPSNRHLDFNLPLSLSNSHLLIPDKRLLDGRWDITIAWEYQGKPYLHKQRITY